MDARGHAAAGCCSFDPLPRSAERTIGRKRTFFRQSSCSPNVKRRYTETFNSLKDEREGSDHVKSAVRSRCLAQVS
jgi:hypothetical protein